MAHAERVASVVYSWHDDKVYKLLAVAGGHCHAGRTSVCARRLVHWLLVVVVAMHTMVVPHACDQSFTDII
jgi:hypothetical protein